MLGQGCLFFVSFRVRLCVCTRARVRACVRVSKREWARAYARASVRAGGTAGPGRAATDLPVPALHPRPPAESGSIPAPAAVRRHHSAAGQARRLPAFAATPPPRLQKFRPAARLSAAPAQSAAGRRAGGPAGPFRALVKERSAGSRPPAAQKLDRRLSKRSADGALRVTPSQAGAAPAQS